MTRRQWRNALTPSLTRGCATRPPLPQRSASCSCRSIGGRRHLRGNGAGTWEQTHEASARRGPEGWAAEGNSPPPPRSKARLETSGVRCDKRARRDPACRVRPRAPPCQRRAPRDRMFHAQRPTENETNECTAPAILVGAGSFLDDGSSSRARPTSWRRAPCIHTATLEHLVIDCCNLTLPLTAAVCEPVCELCAVR